MKHIVVLLLLGFVLSPLSAAEEPSAEKLKVAGEVIELNGTAQNLKRAVSSHARRCEMLMEKYKRLTGQYTGKVHPRGNHTPIITRVKPIYAFVNGWGSPRTVVYDPFAGDGNDKRWHHWGQDMRSARYYIDCFTRERDLVIDPFCGGGTTAVVCKHLKRRWLAFDSDAASVETARGRVRNPFYAPARADGQLGLEFSA